MAVGKSIISLRTARGRGKLVSQMKETKDTVWEHKVKVSSGKVTVIDVRNPISGNLVKRKTKNAIHVGEKTIWPEIVQMGSCVLIASRLAISLGIAAREKKSIKMGRTKDGQ